MEHSPILPKPKQTISFMDCESKVLSPSLREEIRDSKISVVAISNFASEIRLK